MLEIKVAQFLLNTQVDFIYNIESFICLTLRCGTIHQHLRKFYDIYK
jgi:hypothetical protein